MDRSQLRNLIQSGRSIALDCFAIGGKIAERDKMLFRTDLLNKSVLLKRYEKSENDIDSDKEVAVKTVVYFPYDYTNPYDGGESINFGEEGFDWKLAKKISQSDDIANLKEKVGPDLELLALFDSMHSLDPFLFKSKAEQKEVSNLIHPDYFAISAAEWERIRKPIRKKISKLVEKALANMDSGTNATSKEQYVERFLMKIWSAKDIEGIEPFTEAMQIKADKAPEVFFAWKAVCYYQVRFQDILQDVRGMFRWVGDNKLCFPTDILRLTDEEQRYIKRRRNQLRTNMRESYVKAQNVIAAYERSYNKFISENQPQTFMAFLDRSESSYMELAAHVSIATHASNLWKWYVGQYGPEMRYTQFNELFEALTTLYGVHHEIENAVAWE